MEVTLSDVAEVFSAAGTVGATLIALRAASISREAAKAAQAGVQHAQASAEAAQAGVQYTKASAEAAQAGVQHAQASAEAAKASVQVTEKYGKAQMYGALWGDYASPNTYKYICILRDHDEKTKATEEVIDAARFLFNFYHRVHILYEQQLINRRMVFELTSASGYHWTKAKATTIMTKEYEKYGHTRHRSKWFDDFDGVVGRLRGQQS